MKFKQRKHYNGNDWVGHLFAVTIKNKYIRLFVFWKQPDSTARPPFEFQVIDLRNTGANYQFPFVFPKRKPL